MRLRLSLLSLVLGFLFLGAQSSHAKTSRKVSHSYEKVWPTAVRFLRIDEGHKLLEKDMENGYLLFEIAEEGKLFQASVELIRRKDASNRDAVELILSIKDRPSYMEHGILDRMLVKIRKELGLPPNPPEEDSNAEPEKDGDEEHASPSAVQETVK